MKIEKKKEREQFKPVVLMLTISSASELKALQQMSLLNCSIPDLVMHRQGLINMEGACVKDFLDKLGEALGA